MTSAVKVICYGAERADGRRAGAEARNLHAMGLAGFVFWILVKDLMDGLLVRAYLYEVELKL